MPGLLLNCHLHFGLFPLQVPLLPLQVAELPVELPDELHVLSTNERSQDEQQNRIRTYSYILYNVCSYNSYLVLLGLFLPPDLRKLLLGPGQVADLTVQVLQGGLEDAAAVALGLQGPQQAQVLLQQLDAGLGADAIAAAQLDPAAAGRQGQAGGRVKAAKLSKAW